MPTLSHYRTIACLSACLAMTAATAQEANSNWRLRLMGLEHESKAEATLHFTGEPVRSCMRGKWQRLVVDTDEGSDTRFFPLTEPLAYKLEHGVLTMAQTNTCRRLPLLSAISAGRGIHGTFRIVSVGRSQKVGLFSMDPIQ